mgnify:CR=1 FL=1
MTEVFLPGTPTVLLPGATGSGPPRRIAVLTPGEAAAQQGRIDASVVNFAKPREFEAADVIKAKAEEAARRAKAFGMRHRDDWPWVVGFVAVLLWARSK